MAKEKKSPREEIIHKDFIEVFGAREHNLKDIDIKIPKNQLVVFTGVSGSGKSSLAFDTIYNEGQRRYMESFSAYARQFLGDMERPDVDKITGLSPVISLSKRPPIKTPAVPWVPSPRYMISFACCMPGWVRPTAIIRGRRW
jgi:excinuclease ABC subunit A